MKIEKIVEREDRSQLCESAQRRLCEKRRDQKLIQVRRDALDL